MLPQFTSDYSPYFQIRRQVALSLANDEFSQAGDSYNKNKGFLFDDQTLVRLDLWVPL